MCCLDASKDFVLFFLRELPGFLMSEPINVFVGFGFLFLAVRVVNDIIFIGRR